MKYAACLLLVVYPAISQIAGGGGSTGITYNTVVPNTTNVSGQFALQVPTTNLVALYDFTKSTSINGTTATDSSGNGYHATIAGSNGANGSGWYPQLFGSQGGLRLNPGMSTSLFTTTASDYLSLPRIPLNMQSFALYAVVAMREIGASLNDVATLKLWNDGLAFGFNGILGESGFAGTGITVYQRPRLVATYNTTWFEQIDPRNLVPLGPALIGFEGSTATFTTTVDQTRMISTTPMPVGSVNLTQFCQPTGGSANCALDVAMIAIYSSPLSTDDFQSLVNWVGQNFSYDISRTPTTNAPLVLWDGNSIWGYGAMTPQNTVPNVTRRVLANNIAHYNFSVPGITTETQVSQNVGSSNATVWQYCHPGVVLNQFEAGNSFLAGDSQADYETAIANYGNSAMSAGCNIITMGTSPPALGGSFGASFEVWRQGVNAWMRANACKYVYGWRPSTGTLSMYASGASSPFCTVLVDIGSDPVIGTDVQAHATSAGGWSGGVAQLTIGSHLLEAGNIVTVSGVTPSAYNCSLCAVTSVTATTVSYAITSNPGAYSGAGTVTAISPASDFTFVQKDHAHPTDLTSGIIGRQYYVPVMKYLGFGSTPGTINTSPGTCGDAGHVCQLTTNYQGQVTSQTELSVAASGAPLFNVTSSATATAASATSVVGGGAQTVAANILSSAGPLDLKFGGYYTVPNGYAGTLTVSLLVDGSSVASTGTFSPPSNVSSIAWSLNCQLTTRTTGSMGTAIVDCPLILAGGNPIGGMANTSVFTIDTTASHTIDLKATWSSTTGAPSITGTFASGQIGGAPVASVSLQGGTPQTGAAVLNKVDTWCVNNANGVLAGNSSIYEGMWYLFTGNTIETSAIQAAMPENGTFRNAFLSTNTAQGTAGLTLNLRKNKANCGITIPVAGGSAAGNFTDTVNTCSVNQGDLVNWQFVQAAGNVSAQINDFCVQYWH